jgi:hypothetical protein
MAATNYLLQTLWTVYLLQLLCVILMIWNLVLAWRLLRRQIRMEIMLLELPAIADKYLGAWEKGIRRKASWAMEQTYANRGRLSFLRDQLTIAEEAFQAGDEKLTCDSLMLIHKAIPEVVGELKRLPAPPT